MNEHDEGREEKQRIEKDAEELVKKHSADRALNEGRKKWYIAGATAENNRLNDQLAKERQLRKELVGYVIAYKGLASLTSDEDIFIQSLIQKSKDL